MPLHPFRAAAVLLATQLLISSTSADSIALNFASGRNPIVGGSVDTGAAGVVAQQNWNNGTGDDGALADLIDDSGAPTSASATWSSNNTWSVNNNNYTQGNNALMNGYLDTTTTSTTSVTITGIPYGEYDVYLYFDGDGTGRAGLYTVDGVSRDPLRDTANWNFGGGSFSEAASPGDAGNYSRWEAVSASTLVVTARASAGGTRGPLNGIQIVGTSSPGAPEVETLPTQSVTATTATLRAQLIDPGTSTPSVQIHWGTTDAGTGTWQNFENFGAVASPQTLSRPITGLSPNTDHFARAFATNAQGDDWATTTVSFTTPAALPLLTNNTPTKVDAVSATLGATVTDTGGDPPAVTLYYGTTDGGVTPDTWQFSSPLGVQAASASISVTGLNSSTQYFFRAAATNSVGTSWAPSTSNFTTNTLTLPSVENLPATSVAGISTKLNGRVTSTGGDTPTVTFFYGTTDGGTDPDAWDDLVQIGTDAGNFSRTVGSLSPLTTYFFRAFAENTAGGTWASPSLQFTTTVFVPATIVINEIHYDEADKTIKGEFIELHNNSDNPVDLSSWYFSSGVEFAFPDPTTIPSRGYLVIAQHPATVQSQFGHSTALGPWQGKLSNDGETITLRDVSGNIVDQVDYSHGFPWPIVGESPSPSIELIHPDLDNDLGGHWRSAGNIPSPGSFNPANPTPGSASTVLTTNAPPSLRQVDHSPSQPTSTDDVIITIKATDPDGISSVTLDYQIVKPGDYISVDDPRFTANWTTVTMRDDGTGGDTFIGDDTYTVTLPASLQDHRHLVRYRITATDGAATSVTAPYRDDPSPNFAYFVYDAIPDWTATSSATTYDFSQLQQLPVYHLVTTREDHEESQSIPDSSTGSYGGSDYPWQGSLVYDGQVYDHIRFRARGGVWRYSMGKNMWKFDFNRGHRFQARDDYGKKYKTTWRKLNFSSLIQQGNFRQRGEQGLFEWAGFKLHNLLGNPAPYTHFTHFRIVEHADENGPTASQYDTDFQGLYLAIEQLDGKFLDEHGLPDANLYKMEGGSGELNNQGPDQPSNKSDLNTFLTYKQGNKDAQWWRDNLVLDDYYSFRAVATAIHDYDIHASKNFFFYHRPVDPTDPHSDKWQPVNWDLDLTWTTTYNGGGIRGPLSDFVLAVPELALEYRNRMRELLDLAFNTDQAGKILDECARIVHTPGQASFVDADRDMWDQNPILTSSYINSSKAGHNKYWEAASQRTFASMLQHVKDYITSQTSFINSNGSNLQNEAATIPAKPTITYTGPAGFPANTLTFQSNAFADPQGTGTFAALQWRVGEIYNHTTAGYLASDPFTYEIEPLYTSPILTSFLADHPIPPSQLRPGHTYRARVRHQDTSGNWSHWSDPVEFVAGLPDVAPYQRDLVISEFMYHPTDATPGEITAGYSNSDFEWIELQNIGSGTIDLTGVRFTKGVDFDFADATTITPGAYAIIPRNQAAFALRHPTAPATIGAYAPNNLSNGGENLKLSLGAGTAIHEFTYQDSAPWPADADGAGFSLVLNTTGTAHPTTGIIDHANPANWRLSSTTGGSPGTGDTELYAAWKTANGITDDQGDDDDDGLTAFMEFALGTDPSTYNELPSGGLQEQPAGSSSNYLTISFRRRIAADELTFTIQFSTDLAPDSWSEDTAATLVSTTPHGDGTITQQWRFNAPATGLPAHFTRLHVTN